MPMAGWNKDWCSDADTQIYCSEDYARQALAFAISDGVLHKTNGVFDTRVSLQFVYRVFMTREIDRLNAVSGGLNADLQTGAKPPVASPAAPTDFRTSGTATSISTPSGDATQAGSRSELLMSNGVQIGLHEVFQRPLVFGYRAITIAPKSSSPGKALP